MQEVVLSSEPEAQNVLNAMRQLLDNYEQVTVADYLDLVGLSSVFSDEKLGWVDLRNVPIKSINSGFKLELPEPKQLEFNTSAFPFLKGWWFIADVIDDQKYEGWLIDAIGDTAILETEPSKIRVGIAINTVKKFDAYRERPSSPE